jgi:hypothetical protein
VTQDIRNHLEWYSMFELVRRDTVAKHMRAQEWSLHMGPLGPTPYTLSDCGMGESAKRNRMPDKYMPARTLGTSVPKVGSNRLSYGRQQRQINGRTILAPANMED